LTVNFAGAAEPVTAALSGTGFDFTVTAIGTTTQAVASGQTANYTLTIAPVSGSPGGTFTFQSGTLPTNALCLFNPGSETVSAGATGNVAVQISTGQSGSSARSTGPAGWGVVPLVCGLLLLPLGWRRRRTALLLAALLAILAGGVSSCTSSGGGGGGGSGGGGGGGSTPAGTYTIPVTVVSSGVEHSLTLTLTVD
jgi:hypothetical protein